MSSIPVNPAVIQSTPHSAPINSTSSSYTNDSISGNSSSATDSDSDDEGTVYADTKEDLGEGHGEVGLPAQRPDSSMSDISNTHTDNTLSAADNLSDDNLPEPKLAVDSTSSASADNRTNIPSVEVNIESASSTSDSDSDIEKTNIDDLVNVTDQVPVKVSVISEEGQEDVPDETGNSPSENELVAAACIVEEAMKAALDIMRTESEESSKSVKSSAQSLQNTQPVDCDNIGIDLVSDFESKLAVNVVEGNAVPTDDIDDSDEADALSASSLD